MELAAMRLTQCDAVSCGPTVAVVARTLLDLGYRRKLGCGDEDAVGAAGRTWFAAEQRRIHSTVNRMWPRRLGMTPIGVARAISGHGVRYRWRLWWGRRDGLADVLAALDGRWPVAMLVGNVIPRHWVLLVEREGDSVRCYEPSSGRLRPLELASIRSARLTDVGFSRPFAFVLPRAGSRLATFPRSLANHSNI
jgi:hypothetical protein